MSLDISLKASPCKCDECIDEVFSINITHNLITMASKAGLYSCIWTPETLGITKAKEIIKPLAEGLRDLEDRPEYFKTFNPENEWGSYEGLVNALGMYLRACKQYPEAKISIWK